MSRKSQIKAIIDANIKRNGRQEITGPVLNAILNAMLDAGVIDITQDGQILPKDEDGNVEIPSISMDGAVRYDIAQPLTEGQKEIARNNIGAPSNADRDELVAAIVAENERAELAETELGNSVLAETERATQAESELSSRIDTIVQGRNVRDIVANYDELLAYDTSTLGNNDIIMVLLDSTKSGHTTYYKWHTDTQSWEFIGGLAFTYTKTEIDEKFRALHIVIPDIPEAAVEHPEEYQELLAQVDSLVRSAGADASFRMPIDTIGNVDVTFVKYNPAHIYLGIFADDRSVLYTINRTTSQPRSYSVEIVTKEFVTRAEFDAYSEGVAQELDGLSLKVGKFSEITPTLSSGVQIATLKKEVEGQAVETPLYAPQGGGGGIPDAPSDGKTYGRKDGAWAEVQGGGDDTLTRIALGTAGNYVRELTDGHIEAQQDTIKQSNTWNNTNIRRILSGSLGAATSMSYVFYHCTNLEAIEPALIIGKDCTTMQTTFQANSKLEKVDLSHADLSNCTNMQSVFDSCSSLISIGTFTLTLTSVTNLNSAFNGVKLQRLKIVGGNVCTTIQNCFRNCTLLKELDLSEFDASSLTNCQYIILNAPNVETLIGSHTLEEVERGEVVCFNNISCDFPLGEFNSGSKLGRATLLAIIKGLKDLSGGDSKTLTLGSTLRAKLTAEDIAIATNKNWVIA